MEQRKQTFLIDYQSWENVVSTMVGREEEQEDERLSLVQSIYFFAYKLQMNYTFTPSLIKTLETWHLKYVI